MLLENRKLEMQLFNTKHLLQVEESYVEHFKFSFWAGYTLVFLGIVSVVHAFFPFFLSRYPDKLFRDFVEQSCERRERVTAILKSKNIKDN